MEQAKQSTSSRRGMAGFLLAGFSFALLGAVLPAWGFHYTSDYRQIALFFIAMNGGVLLARQFGRGWVRRTAPRLSLAVSATLMAIALAALAFSSPPAPVWMRLASLLLLGFGTGLLYASCFYLVAPAFGRSPSATTNRTGLFFCAGSVLASLAVAGSIEGYQLWLPVAILSILSAAFAVWFSRDGLPEHVMPPEESTGGGLPSTSAILMALVIFFQFGNEWTIAGWLPLLLIQRLGMSPQDAILLLTLYWIALMVGRVLAQPLVQRLRPFRLLAGSTVSVLFACLVLAVTDSRIGAFVAVLLAGAGFSVIYPVLLDLSGRRFANAHPVTFHGVFTLALTGGLLTPAFFGLVAQSAGLGTAMMIPVFGTCMVLLLLVLIRIESRAARPA